MDYNIPKLKATVFYQDFKKEIPVSKGNTNDKQQYGYKVSAELYMKHLARKQPAFFFC